VGPRLIYCADGNARHAGIAVAAGWEYGARLPARGLAPFPLALADQDWKRPDRAAYMAALEKTRPALATVLDWERPEQLPEVLSWAEEAAGLVTEAVLVIPKVSGMVGRIPGRVGGKEVVLAYSVPTAYGGSPLFLTEFAGRPVHLLGGSPQEQRRCWQILRGFCEVRSADGNMHKKMAMGRCCYWTREATAKGHWQPLGGFDGNGPEEAFRRSCENIQAAWSAWT
jgi:hypothetical protein